MLCPSDITYFCMWHFSCIAKYFLLIDKDCRWNICFYLCVFFCTCVYINQPRALSSSCSQCYMPAAIISVHNLLTYAQPIISDLDIPQCHEAQLFSIFSLAPPLHLFPSGLPVGSWYPSFLLLITCPKNEVVFSWQLTVSNFASKSCLNTKINIAWMTSKRVKELSRPVGKSMCYI